jgi:hypothetical protein
MEGAGRGKSLTGFAFDEELVGAVVDKEAAGAGPGRCSRCLCLQSGGGHGVEAPGEVEAGVFVDEVEVVGGFGVIVFDFAAAGGDDGFGGGEVEGPVGDVGDVAPEVDEHAAGVVPEVAVVEVGAVGVEGAAGGGSEPGFVVEAGGGRGVGRGAEALRFRGFPDVDGV